MHRELNRKQMSDFTTLNFVKLQLKPCFFQKPQSSPAFIDPILEIAL